MQPVRPLLNDIRQLAEGATFPEKVLPLLEEAVRLLEAGKVAQAREAAMSAVFALVADPTYVEGDHDLVWLLRASLVSLPEPNLLEEARLLLEEAAARYQGRNQWGEPLPEWERYNSAASRAWRLRRLAEGEERVIESAVMVHRYLDDVIDALLDLLADCEERRRRQRIVTIIGALRLHLK